MKPPCRRHIGHFESPRAQVEHVAMWPHSLNTTSYCRMRHICGAKGGGLGCSDAPEARAREVRWRADRRRVEPTAGLAGWGGRALRRVLSRGRRPTAPPPRLRTRPRAPLARTWPPAPASAQPQPPRPVSCGGKCSGGDGQSSVRRGLSCICPTTQHTKQCKRAPARRRASCRHPSLRAPRVESLPRPLCNQGHADAREHRADDDAGAAGASERLDQLVDRLGRQVEGLRRRVGRGEGRSWKRCVSTQSDAQRERSARGKVRRGERTSLPPWGALSSRRPESPTVTLPTAVRGVSKWRARSCGRIRPPSPRVR